MLHNLLGKNTNTKQRFSFLFFFSDLPEYLLALKRALMLFEQSLATTKKESDCLASASIVLI